MHPIQKIVQAQKQGRTAGIYSCCSANEFVLLAALDRGKQRNTPVLIEATANQVNQFGGYTGMKPSDFYAYVQTLIARTGIDPAQVILGGDHLGPLTWTALPETQAMEYARELVRQFVLAGFTKIHLDTSMRVADDDENARLSDETIARRGAELCAVCEQAYAERRQAYPDAEAPVYIIGSEVPIPGGIQSDDEGMQVTRPEDFEDTLLTYRDEFAKLGLADAWKYIIAVVVQPGVEFGNEQLHHYNREASKKLCEALKRYPDIVFEGHSTDFQSPAKLKEMVEDGIAIIKVGPALTFALREALFALSGMEREYSFSDRCRYYLSQPEVDSAIAKLFYNLDQTDIPMGMLHQYMPLQYIKVRDGRLPMQARELVKDSIITLVDDYNYAVKYNYMTGGIFIR